MATKEMHNPETGMDLLAKRLINKLERQKQKGEINVETVVGTAAVIHHVLDTQKELNGAVKDLHCYTLDLVANGHFKEEHLKKYAKLFFKHPETFIDYEDRGVLLKVIKQYGEKVLNIHDPLANHA